jgi:hypothetical protein
MVDFEFSQEHLPRCILNRGFNANMAISDTLIANWTLQIGVKSRTACAAPTSA